MNLKMLSPTSNLQVVAAVVLVVSVGLCYGGVSPSARSQDADLYHDQRVPDSTGDFKGPSLDADADRLPTDSLVRVRRGGGYGGYGYNNYYGGGGQWTSYCCNYGHYTSPGCQYNGFWNARNNPYCY